jgi:hypothetical protein
VSCGSSGGGGGSTGVCADLTNYTASTATQLSFATDVLPILQDATATGPGCATASICHGTPPRNLYKSTGNETLAFTGSAATVKQMLLAKSVNDPSMSRVTPSSVGTSFLAYKISGQDALACSNLACTSGVSVGTHTPCGDAMPVTVGVLSSSDRAKILDWIAQGAKD